MPALEIGPAKVKREDVEESGYRSILENPLYKKILLSDNVIEIENEVSKIKDKETLIKLINYVVNSGLDGTEKPTNKYTFITLTEHFKELFGANEYDRCFEKTAEKIRERNELISIRYNREKSADYDEFSDSYEEEIATKKKTKKKKWRKSKKKEKSKKNKNKDIEMIDQDLVLYDGQEKKLNKIKKKQSRGKGNWRTILKAIGGIVGSIALGALVFVAPVTGLSVFITGCSLHHIYRKTTGKDKYLKQVSNKIGGGIDKLEDMKIKSNTKRMENELNKFKKEDEQLRNKNKESQNKDKEKNNDVNNQQQNQVQNQQNQMMQNQQNQMMQNQQNQMMQNQQNQMMQQMMQNPAFFWQMMQNPMMMMQWMFMMGQQTNQNPMLQWMNNFQQINTQNQQNQVQNQQTLNTSFQDKLKQQAISSGQNTNGINT